MTVQTLQCCSEDQGGLSDSHQPQHAQQHRQVGQSKSLGNQK